MSTSERYEMAYNELKRMKKQIVTQHGEALKANNDRSRRACDWAIGRLDRGIRELKRHAEAIDDAEAQGNRTRAQVHIDLMNESKDAVVAEVKHELRTYAMEVPEKQDVKPKKKLCGGCKSKVTDSQTTVSHGHGHSHEHHNKPAESQPVHPVHQHPTQQPNSNTPQQPHPQTQYPVPQQHPQGQPIAYPYQPGQAVPAPGHMVQQPPPGYYPAPPTHYAHPATQPLPQNVAPGQPQQQYYLPPPSGQPVPQ